MEQCAVRFAEEVDVPALETGRVADVSVALNQAISTGAPIARLDDRSILIRRRAAQLRLDSARSDASDDVEIRYAEVALAEAEAELHTSRTIQKDVRGAIPNTQLRRLKLAVERGNLEVAQAKKRFKRAELEARLREADLSAIDDQLRNLHVESPTDGVVIDVSKAEGEWINKGESIATVGRIDRLHIHALLRDEQIAPNQCQGLPVSVHWTDHDHQERSLRGKVLSVDPQLLPGGRYRIHAEIANRPLDGDPSKWQLHPGAEVRMQVYPRAGMTRAAASNRSGRR